MDCAKIKEKMIQLIDGKLSADITDEINQHIQSCMSCQREKELLIKSWQLLDAYESPRVRDDFTAAVIRKINQERAQIIKVKYKTPWFRLSQLAPILATLIVALSIGVFFFGARSNKRRLAKKDISVSPGRNVAIREETQQNKEIAGVVSEAEIIENLDILEDMEILDNLAFWEELDEVEALDDLENTDNNNESKEMS